jgi:hypothetical protein
VAVLERCLQLTRQDVGHGGGGDDGDGDVLKVVRS